MDSIYEALHLWTHLCYQRFSIVSRKDGRKLRLGKKEIWWQFVPKRVTNRFSLFDPLGFSISIFQCFEITARNAHANFFFQLHTKKEDSIQVEKSLFLEFHFIVGWNWQRLTVKLNSFFGLLVGLKSLSKCADSGPKEASKPAGDRFLHFRKTNLATN